MDAAMSRCALVVDDDPIQCELLRSALLKRSFGRILVAHDGAAAKRLIEANAGQIDLMLCDLNMPDVDGVEFLSFLGTTQVTSALVIISGAHSSIVKGADKLASALGLNCRGSMRKPVDLRALDAMLAETVAAQ